jgi:hypothetical protein
MSNEKYEELQHLPEGLEAAVLDALTHDSIGKPNVMSRHDLIYLASARMMRQIPDRQIRLAVHNLRIKGNLVCSAPGDDGGYWLAANLEEVDECCRREFHAKAMDLLKTENAMHEAARLLFGDAFQLALLEEA